MDARTSRLPVESYNTMGAGHGVISKWSGQHINMWAVVLPIFVLACTRVTAIQCSCDEFYQHTNVTKQGCFPVWNSIFYVETLDMAEFLCTTKRDTCHGFTWKRVDSVTLRVSEQRREVITGQIEIQIGMAADDVFDCLDRAFVGKSMRKPSLLPGAFSSGSACAFSMCPEATIDPRALAPKWQRYVNQGNQLVCNVAACQSRLGASADECSCNAQQRQCACGNLWTGDFRKRTSYDLMLLQQEQVVCFTNPNGAARHPRRRHNT